MYMILTSLHGLSIDPRFENVIPIQILSVGAPRLRVVLPCSSNEVFDSTSTSTSSSTAATAASSNLHDDFGKSRVMFLELSSLIWLASRAIVFNMKQHLCIVSDLFCWGSIGSQTTTTSTSTTTTTSTSLHLSTTQALLQNHGLLSPRWAICIVEVTTLGKIAGMGCGTAAAWQMLCDLVVRMSSAASRLICSWFWAIEDCTFRRAQEASMWRMQQEMNIE